MGEEKEEKDEIAESSWLNQWISGLSAGSEEDRTFVLKLTSVGNDVRLSINNPDGELDTTTIAEQLRKGLLVQLR